MKNKKKLGIFSFIICLLTTVFVFSLNKTFAETPEISVTGKFVDAITDVKVVNNEGGDLTWDLAQWATFRINAKFDLSGKNVKAGDTTVMTVPDALVVTSQSFEIRDINTNEIIAHAKVSADNKSISLTYTDYVEKHNDTNGSFFFYARVDFKKHPQQGEIPIEITINKESKPAGKITFKGIGDGDPKVLTKTSWVNEGDKREVQYTISVNRTKQNIKGVTIEDHLQFTNASYVKDSIKVIKGKFSFETGEWVFSDRVDVTDQHKVTVAEDGQSFVVDLGDITEADQYRISYNVRLNYDPVDGELLKNEATLKGVGIESTSVINGAAVQIAGGAGLGYVYSINIHKVDEANQPLKGAKFKVVRQANNQVIGEYETDENGKITVNALLKDKYILTETEAPSGYVIKVADTEVNVDDFGADHSVTKTIVNPKEETTTTTTTTTTEAPTTSTTTTEAPTTSTTTTEAPTTSVTTTEAPTTSTTTTEAPTTSVTTTEAPTTSTTTTEAPTTSVTTTEAPTTSVTTTEAPTTSVTTTEAPTTSVTTTEAPTTSVTTTTPSSSSETTTEEKPGLPFTGESKGTLIAVLGSLVLVSSIIVLAKTRKTEKD
ncbi:Ig-like domain-containing protein [Streptococcus sp. CF4-2]|uniref:Ig-like domain-containing protein n=1 Tax=unclassified Streptococcus TaxID=2608887 RepID=UPI0020C9679B|nr:MULTISPECIES: Ig-like domain-containing protein [unclassified Streptococcus]MCP9075535.1 Ig-like domain-containing protein [Streptococcus sp. CF4-3]MCP9088348.1 Ig-like domain-containing protein [Streptococcus sp. CF4-2]